MSKVELKSTHKGLVGEYIKNSFWTIAGGLGIGKAFDIAQNIYAKVGASNLGEYTQTYILDRGVDNDLTLIGLGFGAFISGIIVLHNTSGILNNFYRAKTTNVLDKDGGKVKETSYGFPAKRKTNELKFERITRAEVSQGSVDRLLDTGTLTLEVLTYTNADSSKRNWEIPHIEEPETAKQRVLEGLPNHEGLEVKIIS